MTDSFFYLAFATGLLGFAHCAGMCGGLVAALALHHKEGGRIGFVLTYQVGRILTYTLLGWGGALLGAALLYSPWFARGARALLIGSDIFVIILGLAGLKLLPRPKKLLDAPGAFAASAARLTGRLGRSGSVFAPLLLGALFGFLPCGFLYPTLISAIATGDPTRAALTMLAFGLGTFPALFFVGSFAAGTGKLARWAIPLAWLAVIAMGGLNLYRHLAMRAACCG